MTKSIRNLESAQAVMTKANADFATVKKAPHNADLYVLTTAAKKECERFSNRKTDLNSDDMKSFSKSLTQYRYRTECLIKGDNALQWMHKHGIKSDVTARNTYGKALYFVDKILGNAPMKYEQSSYAQRAWVEVIAAEKPKNGVVRVTARKLAYACGAGEEPLGQTQPYAILKALDIVKAGARTMAGRGSDWSTSYVDIDVNSALYKAVSAQ